jgi:ankyrin repeat protein
MRPPRIFARFLPTLLCAVGLLTRTAGAQDEPVAHPDPVAAGALASTADERGRSPLLTATLGREWGRVRELLTAGAETKLADDQGLTPLMAAAIAGHVPTIEALLANGAPPDAVDAHGRMALGYAISRRQSAAVAALLARQPTLPEAAQGGDDLAAVALECGERELLEDILRRLPGGLTWTPAARTAFSQALASHDTIMGPLLLAKFAGPPAPSEHAQPLLAYAIARADLGQMRTLLDFGADPNTVLDQPGDLAFREWINTNFVRYYLDTAPGLNVLMLAAGSKQTETVKLLLEYGANRFASTRGRSSLIALYFACWAESAETVQALIPEAPTKHEAWIDISLNEQRARYYRHGDLLVNTIISTGRAGFATKTGEFVITDKHREHRSTIYHEASMPFFMRLSCAAFGMHQGYVTGQPASHGCIRLPGEVAQRLFREVPIGTWVTIRR